jgi:hypothetical protein
MQSADFIPYAQGLGAKEAVIQWINSNLANYIKKNEPTTSEVEHIIDWMMSDKAPPRLQRVSYAQAHSAAEKWNKTLQKNASGIVEKKSDVQTVLDFKDGFRIVKLVGKAAYEREGFLMRHCVSGYFGRDVEIFSLRDKNNDPHCTMEKDNQIKGKGNGDIHPKYIDYVVRFLEHSGMAVRDSEMSHLGYELVPFGGYAKTKLYRDKYAVKGTAIEYRDDVRFFESKTELKNYQGDMVCLFKGNLVIEEKEKFVHKSLAEVSGSVVVEQGATFTAPKLASSGSVVVRQGATFTAPKLGKVSGSVVVRQGATFTAPKLGKVSGYVVVRQGATFTAPKLGKVSGYVVVEQGATFTAPKLASSGSVDVRQGATFTAPKLGKVSGSVDVRQGATFTAPKLASSGSVDVRQGATFTAPKLKRKVA